MQLKELKGYGDKIFHYCAQVEYAMNRMETVYENLKFEHLTEEDGDFIAKNISESERLQSVLDSLTSESVFGGLYLNADMEDKRLLDALLAECVELFNDYALDEVNIASQMCAFLDKVCEMDFADKTFGEEDISLIKDAGFYFATLAQPTYDEEKEEFLFVLDETMVDDFLKEKGFSLDGKDATQYAFDEVIKTVEERLQDMDSYTRSETSVVSVLTDFLLERKDPYQADFVGELQSLINNWNEYTIHNFSKDLSLAQQEFFKENGLKNTDGSLIKFYHGTPYGGYDSFKDGTHFSDNKDYAERYTSLSASSNCHSIQNKEKLECVYEVYIAPKKVFDTTYPECQAIFEQYVQSGCACGINPYEPKNMFADSGYPDWTEAENLMEFLLEEGYDYDFLILDEGSDGGYGEPVTWRGFSYVPFNGCEVKETSDLTPKHDGKMNSKYAPQVNRDKTFVHKEAQDKKGNQKETKVER